MSIPCNVVLLPSKDLASKAIAASRAMQKYETFFTLEDGKFYPHLSLYMFQLEEADVTKVKEILAAIALVTDSIRATAIAYSLGQGFAVGYVDSEYEVTKEQALLQNVVVEALNPIRTGMRERDIIKMQTAQGMMLRNLQKFGYSAIGELFRPHITLTRLKEHNPDVLNLLPKDVGTFSGTFDRIGFFEMGANGTCVRQIATWNMAE